jgi:histidinol-phosphate aminotransferase
MSDGSGEATYLRPHLRGLESWNPTATAAGEHLQMVRRMDLNECPYPPSPKVQAAINGVFAHLNRYADGACPDLAARLAGTTGVPAPHICFGPGSTELLKCIVEIAVAPGDNLVSPALLWHRFHGIFEALEADATLVPNRADGGIDVERLTRAIGNRTRMAVVITPNNPTGMMLSEAELLHVIRTTPDNVLLFIDEAYYEFAIQAGGPDALKLLQRERPNGPWIVSRTFSKAYALAGLRLGYAMCSSEEIANAVRLMSSTFVVSAFAEAAAMAALDDADYSRFIVEDTARERARIMDGLRRLGCPPMASVTNFVSANIGQSGAEMVAKMRARGIRIARWSYPDYANYIRVSMGSPEDTDAFLETLGDLLRMS